MSPVLLAIDAGGTTTRCAAITDDARCIGFARFGPANPTSAGPAVAITSLASAAAAALTAAETTGHAVRGVTLAMAGIGAGTAFARDLGAALAEQGVRAPLHFDSDAMAGFCSGTAATSGSVLISGTGAAAVRIREGRAEATADGLGWLLGDVGSGFWVGHRVVRAALAHLDRRGPETALTALLVAAMPPSTTDDIGTEDGRPPQVMRILTSTYAARPVELARLAPLAFIAAAEGDPVAAAIVEEAVEGLHATLRAVRGPISEPVVATGGLLAKQPALRRGIEDLMRAEGTALQLIPVDDGLTGAAVLALREAGVPVDEATRRALHASIDTARGVVAGTEEHARAAARHDQTWRNSSRSIEEPSAR